MWVAVDDARDTTHVRISLAKSSLEVVYHVDAKDYIQSFGLDFETCPMNTTLWKGNYVGKNRFALLEHMASI